MWASLCYGKEAMKRKNFRHWVSLVIIAVMTAGQLFVSAHACSIVQPSSLLGTPDSSASASVMHCEEMDGMHTEKGKDVASQVCHEHCVQPSQSSQTAAPDMPVYSLVALFEIPRLTTESFKVSHFVFSQHTTAVSSSPPLRIQYQTFRI